MMEKVRLKDIGTIVTGNTPSKKKSEYYINKDICFFKPSDIEDYGVIKLKKSEEHISEKAREKVRMLPKNTVLVTCIGTIGKVGIIEKEACCNQQINAIVPNDNINSKYLAYAVLSKKYWLQKKANAPVVPIINKSDFSNVEILIHNIEEQNVIVNQLDKVQEIIDLRKKQIEELDEVIKSQFVKMFGDPISNQKGFEKVDFVNVVKLQRGYDLPNQDRNKKGLIPVYGANGILDKHTISKSKNGIITGRSGTIGKVYYSFEEFWPLNTTLFSIETYGNNIVYLKYLLDMFNLKRFIDATGVPTLNRNIVHKQKIINAPIELQNKFADFVKQIDKQKFILEKALKETEELQESLMNKYFS